jgi:hypothetical protein
MGGLQQCWLYSIASVDIYIRENDLFITIEVIRLPINTKSPSTGAVTHEHKHDTAALDHTTGRVVSSQQTLDSKWNENVRM